FPLAEAFHTAARIEFEEPGQARVPLTVRPCGFSFDEHFLPADRAFAGYSALSEFFRYPFKHLFIGLSGFSSRARTGTVRVHLNNPPNRVLSALAGVAPNVCRVNCVPVVNIVREYAQTARLAISNPVSDATRRLPHDWARPVVPFAVHEIALLSEGAEIPC